MNNDLAYQNMLSSVKHKIAEDGSDVDEVIQKIIHVPGAISKKCEGLRDVLYQLDFYIRYMNYFIHSMPSSIIDNITKHDDLDSNPDMIKAKELLELLQKKHAMVNKKLSVFTPYVKNNVSGEPA